MPDALFAEPRLARIYDAIDADRDDLSGYLAMAREFGARSVLDVGCGTGTFACLLAAAGLDVTAVDPAAASLDVAKAKPGAAKVRWLHGDATGLPPMRVDLAVMTGNVAQVFVTDADWNATLRGIRDAVRPGGRFVFETRDPAREAWRGWGGERTRRRVDVPGAGAVEIRSDLLDVRDEGGLLVTFRTSYQFASDGAVRTSQSTLRFRGQQELAASLGEAGFIVDEIRDTQDRPGLEWVYVTR